QTLPDGTGQLTNVELGAIERIEIRRGPSSAMYGNAAGGVINLLSEPWRAADRAAESLRFVGGDNWYKGQSVTRLPVGQGHASLVVSRMRHQGERQHSGADYRSLLARYIGRSGARWQLAVNASLGDQPRADNPGALTAA